MLQHLHGSSIVIHTYAPFTRYLLADLCRLATIILAGIGAPFFIWRGWVLSRLGRHSLTFVYVGVLLAQGVFIWGQAHRFGYPVTSGAVYWTPLFGLLTLIGVVLTLREIADGLWDIVVPGTVATTAAQKKLADKGVQVSDTVV